MPSKAIFSLFGLVSFFLSLFFYLFRKNVLRLQYAGTAGRGEGGSPGIRSPGNKIPARAWQPIPWPLLPHSPSSSLGKWGAPRASEQGSDTCALGQGPGVSAERWGGRGAADGALPKPSRHSSFSPSSLLPPCDTLLSLPPSLFSSPSIPLSPSAPPVACQLPADDISFHVWG